MPLYEYQCDTCSHRFEVIQKYSDAPIDVCPKCGGPVKKLLSSPAIQFKGSGFYINDYAAQGRQRRPLVLVGGIGDQVRNQDRVEDRDRRPRRSRKKKPTEAT